MDAGRGSRIMILYITIAVVTILLAAAVRVMPNGINHRLGGSLYNFPGNKWSRQQALNGLCLFSIFIILFGLSACRLNVGNDYAKYVEFMHLIAVGAYDYVPTEAGFNALVTVLYAVSGYENFLLVFAVFAFFTLLFFLKAMYEQSDSFGFSFFYSWHSVFIFTRLIRYAIILRWRWLCIP